jgi:hypothetical protein
MLDVNEVPTAFNAEYEEDPESLIHHYTDATIAKDLREALEGPDGVHWLKAWPIEMYRLQVRKTWVDIQDAKGMGKCFSTSTFPLSISSLWNQNMHFESQLMLMLTALWNTDADSLVVDILKS